jgi:hypothetical protein
MSKKVPTFRTFRPGAPCVANSSDDISRVARPTRAVYTEVQVPWALCIVEYNGAPILVFRPWGTRSAPVPDRTALAVRYLD